MATLNPPRTPLPVSHVRSAVLRAIAVARYVTVYTRNRAANSINARIRLKPERHSLVRQATMFHEEIHIKEARRRIRALQRARSR